MRTPVVDDVFAYSNGRGDDRSLIVFHNRFGEAAGWIRDAVRFADKHEDGSKTQRGDDLANALGLSAPDDAWLRQLALRLGGALRVLDPPELAEDVAAAARSALAAYSAAGPAHSGCSMKA